jgi:hypothetical protein
MTARDLSTRLDRLERGLLPPPAPEPITVRLIFEQADGTYTDQHGRTVKPDAPGAVLLRFG